MKNDKKTLFSCIYYESIILWKNLRLLIRQTDMSKLVRCGCVNNPFSLRNFYRMPWEYLAVKKIVSELFAIRFFLHDYFDEGSFAEDTIVCETILVCFFLKMVTQTREQLAEKILCHNLPTPFKKFAFFSLRYSFRPIRFIKENYIKLHHKVN